MRGREIEGSTADSARKRLETQSTPARTMEVPLSRASALHNCCFNCHLGRVTRTMFGALLLRNNPKQKKSNFRSPTPRFMICSGLT